MAQSLQWLGQVQEMPWSVSTTCWIVFLNEDWAHHIISFSFLLIAEEFWFKDIRANRPVSGTASNPDEAGRSKQQFTDLIEWAFLCLFQFRVNGSKWTPINTSNELLTQGTKWMQLVTLITSFLLIVCLGNVGVHFLYLYLITSFISNFLHIFDVIGT